MCDAYYIYLIIDKSAMQYMAQASFEQPIINGTGINGTKGNVGTMAHCHFGIFARTQTPNQNTSP